MIINKILSTSLQDEDNVKMLKKIFDFSKTIAIETSFRYFINPPLDIIYHGTITF
jgi:hypothetical protein